MRLETSQAVDHSLYFWFLLDPSFRGACYFSIILHVYEIFKDPSLQRNSPPLHPPFVHSCTPSLHWQQTASDLICTPISSLLQNPLGKTDLLSPSQDLPSGPRLLSHYSAAPAPFHPREKLAYLQSFGQWLEERKIDVFVRLDAPDDVASCPSSRLCRHVFCQHA